MGILPNSNMDGHLRDRVMQDVTVQVIWCGCQTAIQTSPDLTQVPILGGIEQIIAYQLFFRKAAIPRLPTIGEVMVINDVKMRVLGVKESPDGNLVSAQMGFAKEL